MLVHIIHDTWRTPLLIFRWEVRMRCWTTCLWRCIRTHLSHTASVVSSPPRPLVPRTKYSVRIAVHYRSTRSVEYRSKRSIIAVEVKTIVLFTCFLLFYHCYCIFLWTEENACEEAADHPSPAPQAVPVPWSIQPHPQALAPSRLPSRAQSLWYRKSVQIFIMSSSFHYLTFQCVYIGISYVRYFFLHYSAWDWT